MSNAIKKGSADQLNILEGVGSALCATNAEIEGFNVPLEEGSMIFNTTKKTLVISDGITPPKSLPNHRHTGQYAEVVHNHIFSPQNEIWRMSEPRLWYRPDLENHTELIPLEGQEISSDEATYLSTVYSGSKLITNEITSFTDGAYQNAALTLSADTFVEAGLPCRVFNGPVTVANVTSIRDQWNTGDPSLNNTHTLTISFKNYHTYRPTEYWIMPGNGSTDGQSLGLLRPAPNSWVLEGSNDNETWTTLDTITNYTNWAINQLQVFPVDSSIVDNYSYLRLRVTAWNAGEIEDLPCSIKRFWVFGHKNGVFTMPNIEPPSEEFCWVVPYKDLNVGLKREDVGDIGLTSVMSNTLPAYRLKADGSNVRVEDHEELYSAIGHSHDPLAAVVESPTMTGGMISVEDNLVTWTCPVADENTPIYIEIPLADTSKMLGGYRLKVKSTRKPISWMVEGVVNGQYVTLASYVDVPLEHYENANGEFLIDTSISDVAVSAVRITIVKWHVANENNVAIELGYRTHAIGTFFLPTLSSPVEGAYPYIVANNTVDDASAEIISRLQRDVARLSQTLSQIISNGNADADTVDYEGEIYPPEES